MNKTKKLSPAVFVILGILLLVVYVLFGSIGIPMNFPIPQFGLPGIRSDSVSVGELKRALANKNFVLINVHTPYAGEISGTDFFIPYDRIATDTTDLPNDKNIPIILYCRSGRMSHDALISLKKMGYTNVRELTGGMEALKKAGWTILNRSSANSEPSSSQKNHTCSV